MKNVVIRTDASIRIGTGHVMRCLTLAKKLTDAGCNVVFLCKQHNGNLNLFIKEQGFELIALSAPINDTTNQLNDKLWLGCHFLDDANECLQLILRKTPIDLLIIDHYSIDHRWQNIVKENMNKFGLQKLMVIDDLANRKHHCDILLDQTLGRCEQDYTELVPNKCQLLLGEQFMLLRDEFLQYRTLAKNKRAITSNIHHLLISMGGTDPDNITGQVLDWLIAIKANMQTLTVTVVANQASDFIMNIQRVSDHHNWINLVLSPPSMAKLMLEADIAIGSSGATSWERCCLGLPTLSIISAKNQQKINENLTKQQAIIPLGWSQDVSAPKLESVLQQLSRDINLYLHMTNRCFKACDGLGAKNVAINLLKVS